MCKYVFDFLLGKMVNNRYVLKIIHNKIMRFRIWINVHMCQFYDCVSFQMLMFFRDFLMFSSFFL